MLRFGKFANIYQNNEGELECCGYTPEHYIKHFPYHHRSENSEAIGAVPQIWNTSSDLFSPQRNQSSDQL
jgi:hypothetical protein